MVALLTPISPVACHCKTFIAKSDIISPHDRADLIGALGSGLLNERRDVAVWRIQPDVARNAQVINPGRFQRILLGGDELPAQRVMRRRGGIQLKAKLSIKGGEKGGWSAP